MVTIHFNLDFSISCNVNLIGNNLSVEKQSKDFSSRSLPKIDAMLEWGVIRAGDIIVAKDHTDKGILLKNGNVSINGKELSMQMWLKDIFGWSSIQTYNFAIHKESGKSYHKFVRSTWLSRLQKY
jgi:hypothetical protein